MAAILWPVPAGKGDRAKMRLIQAAARVFGERGLAGATVREIARAAGQNVAAIAYHFGGKEKLYAAVLESLAVLLRETMADVLAEIAVARKRGLAPDEALTLLKEFVSAFYLRILSRKEAAEIGRLIVREQTQPSASFEILYEKAFRGLHETLCFLVGTALGADPKAQATLLHTHSLMGQVWFFAISRETILRRLGWRTLEGKNAEVVVQVFTSHVELLIRALRASGLRAQRHPLSHSPSVP